MREGHWDPFNRERLQALIAGQGSDHPGYRPEHPPYAVFDWDNTSVFLDVEEAVLAYQLHTLDFAASPDELDAILRKGVPPTDFAPSYNNRQGSPVSIDRIAVDIVASYRRLWGTSDRQSPDYRNFVTKLRYLYEAIDGSFGASIAYPWITYLFAGMDRALLERLTREALAWQLAQPIAEVYWESPSELSGAAGVVSVRWKSGLRLLPEMQDLYATLRANGFDVWVVTASLTDVIRVISSEPRYGYNNPADHVIGMELERDAMGRLRAEYRHDYPQTHHHGKTVAIRRFLVPKYGYGPALVAGDSSGDENMMQDFADVRLVLIMNLLRDPGTDIGRLSRQAVESYGKPDARVLLQGRDDNLGQLVPSQASFRFGSHVAQKLPA